MSGSYRWKQLSGMFILVAALASPNLHGYEFAGGSGTLSDPYQIAEPSHLISIGSTAELLDKHFELIAEIDLTGHTFARAVIAPDLDDSEPGFQGTSFSGSFHGRGHRIANLTIAGQPGSSYLGLFGVIASHPLGLGRPPVVELGVCDATIEGQGECIGILAGCNLDFIERCYTSGSVSGTTRVGGLVGENGFASKIRDCYSTASVTGIEDVGGLVGRDNYGAMRWDPIVNCYAAGTVISDPNAAHVGGLVGYHLRMPEEDFATRCYFLRAEDGGGPNNGLGQPLSAAALTQRGSFAGWDFVETDRDGTDDIWYLPDDSYPVLNWQVDVRGIPDVNGLTVEEAAAVLADSGFTVGAEPLRDYHRTKAIGDVITSDPYGYAPAGSQVDIVVSRGPCDWNDVPGAGTPDDPYRIATAGVLEAVSDHYNRAEACFELTDDINMSGRQDGGAVIDFSGPRPGDFAGTFDGRNHTIRHLNARLFDITYGEIRNVRVENADIRGGPHVGILAGENRRWIHNCHVSGRVAVSNYYYPGGYTASSAGGLVGTNTNTVTECHAAVEVTGQENIGGLVGDNTGTITDSHAEGPVTGRENSRYVGGLVGNNRSENPSQRGNIFRCWATGYVRIGDDSRSVGGLVGDNTSLISGSYASGTVRAGYNVNQWPDAGAGGLVGFNAGEITFCYATGPVSGQNNLGGLVGYNSNPITDWSGQPTTGRVRNCYATGNVSSWAIYPLWPPLGESDYIGGLIGRNLGQLRNGYFLDPNDGGGPDNGQATPLSDAEMRSPPSFVGWDFYDDDEDGPADHWFGPEDGYPLLSWQTEKTGLVPIPEILGMSPEEAWSQLESAGFAPGDANQTDYHRTLPAGSVLLARPRSYAPAGSAVGLVLSQGPYDWSDNPGTGVAGDPYLIASAGQLESLRDHPGLWDAHFALTGDIDLFPRSYPTALIASGIDVPPFTGSFDGRGHCIANLVIDTTGPEGGGPALGLFGQVGPEAKIQNLNVRNAKVTCGFSGGVGILAGTAEGTIADCHVTGEIDATNSNVNAIGGMVGEATGAELLRCSATVFIEAWNRVGGLVGVNGGSIRCCYADASIRAGNTVGGLAGQNSGAVQDCYACGSVSGSTCVGALVGTTGSTGGSVRTRATVGIAAAAGIVVNCYSTASVKGSAFYYPACLVGCGDADDVIESFFLIADEQAPCQGPGTPLTHPQMQVKANFAGWDFYGSDEDGTDDHWFMPDGAEPVLTWQTEASGARAVPDLSGLTVEQARHEIEVLGLAFGDIIGQDYFFVPQGRVGLAFAQGGAGYAPLGSPIYLVVSLGAYEWETMNPGDGSAEAPYEIETPGQLESLIERPDLYGAHFVLTSDIDLIGRTYSHALFPPYIQIFSGSLDGRGHTIANLTIQAREDAGPLGLFSIIAQEGRVLELGLQNVRITGRAPCGALAGQNYGAVARCYSTATINGLGLVGGLVGENLGDVTDCYTSGSVHGLERVGGLIGGNGRQGGRGSVGHTGNVSNCYTTASVSPVATFGALIGLHAYGDIVNSYYLLGQDSPVPDNAFGQALTDSQMKSEGSFIDWDFETIWTICENQDYPRLSWENTLCP
ncbi:MAG: PASTA domain-containing protein [Sedimentisphaerales bacterium]|nr:PASTA domain-containing protein [Sedimentisphaerales bacterium]